MKKNISSLIAACSFLYVFFLFAGLAVQDQCQPFGPFLFVFIKSSVSPPVSPQLLSFFTSSDIEEASIQEQC